MSGLDYLLGVGASIIANFLSALAGGGSGLFLLPALLFLSIPFQTALATHKIATVGLGLSASSRHWRERLVEPRFCLWLVLFGTPGVVIGALIATSIPEQIARIALGFLILSLAMLAPIIAKPTTQSQTERHTALWWLVGAGGVFAIGVLNGALSSGSGLFFTFWLVYWFKKTFTEALSYTMIVSSLVYNSIGAVVLGLEVSVNWGFVIALTVGAVIGGYTGSSVSLRKGDGFIKRVFTISCVLIGASLIYSGMESVL